MKNSTQRDFCMVLGIVLTILQGLYLFDLIFCNCCFCKGV